METYLSFLNYRGQELVLSTKAKTLEKAQRRINRMRTDAKRNIRNGLILNNNGIWIAPQKTQ
jgi:hypothetical protein